MAKLSLFGGSPRDRARISPFTGKLMTLWLKYQDLRFFQLVSIIELELKSMGFTDGFNAEEDTITKAIDKLIAD